MVESNSMLPNKLAFVDIETTGTSASYGRIIEIGIVRVENNEVVKTFQTLINPETFLPPEIALLTGITQKDLEGKPAFNTFAKEIYEILQDCLFVAHNARFDYSFLKYSFIREEMSFTAKQLCTVKLSRSLYPTERHHNLDAVIRRCGLNCEQRHRAFDDAKAIWNFYKHAKENFPEAFFLEAINKTLKRPSLPNKLTHEIIDSLPELPGVYIFYGSQSSVSNSQLSDSGLSVFGNSDKQIKKLKTDNKIVNPQRTTEGLQPIPLYIGKSNNIRERVLSHFAGDIRSSKEMSINQQIERIETIVTAGELGALFLEATLIKKMLPLYNRMLRLKHELIALKRDRDKDGYDYIIIGQVQSMTSNQLDSYLGLFKSRKHAKNFLSNLAKEFQLCEKMLGLEKTSGACFAYRLGRCKGACVKKELPLMYNFRNTTAFSKTKIRPWPFPGPVIIEEDNQITKQTEVFLINKWCYLGSIQMNGEYIQEESFMDDAVFDLDMYKILNRYMRDKKNNKKIRSISYEELYKLSGNNTSATFLN